MPLRTTSVNKIKIPMVKMNVNLLSSRSNNKQDDFPTDPKDDWKSQSPKLLRDSQLLLKEDSKTQIIATP